MSFSLSRDQSANSANRGHSLEWMYSFFLFMITMAQWRCFHSLNLLNEKTIELQRNLGFMSFQSMKKMMEEDRERKRDEWVRHVVGLWMLNEGQVTGRYRLWNEVTLIIKGLGCCNPWWFLTYLPLPVDSILHSWADVLWEASVHEEAFVQREP